MRVSESTSAHPIAFTTRNFTLPDSISCLLGKRFLLLRKGFLLLRKGFLLLERRFVLFERRFVLFERSFSFCYPSMDILRRTAALEKLPKMVVRCISKLF